MKELKRFNCERQNENKESRKSQFDFWRFHVYNGAENKNFTSIKKFWILIFFEKHSWYAVSMDVLSVNDYLIFVDFCT